MIRVRGQGPSVVLTQGLGMSASSWDTVAADLAADHTVVTFDRPGLGEHPQPRTTAPALADDVDRLREAISVAGGPAVIVAHSMAAFPAEALARQYPDDVAGLVLLDPSVEESPRRSRIRIRLWHGAARALHRVGPAPRSWSATVFEDAAYPLQARELLAVRAHAGPVRAPAAVVTAQHLVPLPGQALWHDRHQGLAAALAVGHPGSFEAVRHVVLTPSGHRIMTDRPGAVAALARSAADSDQRSRT